jgi:hypothetical protein
MTITEMAAVTLSVLLLHHQTYSAPAQNKTENDLCETNGLFLDKAEELVSLFGVQHQLLSALMMERTLSHRSRSQLSQPR